ncbi:MAG: hypothetical protein JXQ72_02610 [Anaerolineae bacterium]|nr:hypothetical protein [Anaerolineae bacterium]
MRHKLMTFVALLLAVVLIVSASGTLLAQSTERPLAGYKIYFSEDGNAASRFDRTNDGASRLAGLLQRLGADFYTLEWRKNIPEDADLIVIVGPLDDLGAQQTARLWTYLDNGGRLLLLAEPQYARVRAFRANDGLFQLTWADLSIQGQNYTLVEEGELRTITITEQVTNEETGEKTDVERDVEAPILITDFVTSDLDANHPITSGLTGELAFFTARPLEVDASIQVAEVTALAFGGSEQYGESDYNRYLTDGFSEYLEDKDTARGRYPVAAASALPDGGMRVVLIGDRDFVTNGWGFQTSPPNSPNFLYPNNVQFVLNAVSWLLEIDPIEFDFDNFNPAAPVSADEEAAPETEEAPAAEGDGS